jgi:hypothetical protein
MQRKELTKLGYDYDYLLKFQCHLLEKINVLEEYKQKLESGIHKILTKQQQLESIKQKFEQRRELLEQIKQTHPRHYGLSSYVFIGYEASSSKPIISFDKTSWWHNGRRQFNVKNTGDYEKIENISIYNKPGADVNLIEVIESRTKSIQNLTIKITDCDNEIQYWNKRYFHYINQTYNKEKKRYEEELTYVNMLFLQPDFMPPSKIISFERNVDEFFQSQTFYSQFFSNPSSIKRAHSQQNLEESQQEPQNKKRKLDNYMENYCLGR